MPHNMEKRGNLFLHRAVYSVSQHFPLPKQVTQIEKWSSTHTQHLNALSVIAILYFVQVGLPFQVHFIHGGITDLRPWTTCRPQPSHHICINNRHKGSCLQHKHTSVIRRIHLQQCNLQTQVSVRLQATDCVNEHVVRFNHQKNNS
jgi:hypothetical protein